MLGRRACLLVSSLLILGTLLVFSGCPTPPKAEPRVTALESLPAGLSVLPADEGPIERVILSDKSELNVAVHERFDAVLPEEKLQLPHGKLPFSAWAQLCGFTEARS